MRASPDRIKAAILHPDQEVRSAAIFYFARGNTTDRGIVPLAIQAIETYGFDAFHAETFLWTLPQTDATVAWLIDRIERLEPGEDERASRHRECLVSALRVADIDVLRRHAPAIQAMSRLNDEAKRAIAGRIAMQGLSPKDLWRSLMEYCEQHEGQEEAKREDYEFPLAIGEALCRHGDQFAERVVSMLGDMDALGEWVAEVLVQLAGQMRLEPAIPALVACLNESGVWICELAHEALARIGTDAVVHEIARLYRHSDWPFRMSAAGTLEDIHSDLSVTTCLELAADEQDEEVQGMLLQGALLNFATEAIEPARRHVLRVVKSPEMLEVRTALLTACLLMDERFPEYEDWLRDSASDVEFRCAWYEQNPLRFDDPADDDWEDEEVDWDDDPGEGPYDDENPDDPPVTIVRKADRVGRNDPCPCGSGKKFKNCCQKALPPETDGDNARAMGAVQPTRYPIGTVAWYGPDDQSTTKVVASVIKSRRAEPILKRWVGSKVATDPKVKRQIKDFLEGHHVRSVVATNGNIGCPHEEGQDFPVGGDCPFCPFWAERQGSGAE